MDNFKLFLITCIVIYTIPCTAQEIKTKDGVLLGEREDLISSCIQGADNELMNINGLEVETYKYCACFCDNLMPNLYSWEIEKAIEEDKLLELFFQEQNLEILMKCLEGNFTVTDDYKFEYSNNPELEKKLCIINCVNEVMNNEEKDTIWTEELATQYCNCAIDKLFTAGYTYKDIMEMDDENSESFNEVVVPCISEVLNYSSETQALNSYRIEDIEGDVNRCLVPLVDYFGQGFKVKISISGVTRYYLFDTGASDLIINSDVEEELLLNGVLKKDNYLYKTKYTLANNTIVEAQLVKIDNIAIGDYTLNNVVLAILDEGSLLCGKSFLDKFKKWEIDQKNSVLILYK